MTVEVRATLLTREAFQRFGDVLDAHDEADFLINQGKCRRHHDRARLDFAGGTPGISIFDAEARSFPYSLDLVERHPLGSQAFLPLSGTPFLVAVADDSDGRPGPVQAFLTAPGQGVNLLRGVWHGVLAPIGERGHYAVVDRIGAESNLEEFHFEVPPTILPPS